MQATEIKFLFDEVIFTAKMFVLQQSREEREVMVTINTKYLINQFKRTYKFVMSGNKFKPTHAESNRENILIDAIKQAVLHVIPSMIS